MPPQTLAAAPEKPCCCRPPPPLAPKRSLRRAPTPKTTPRDGLVEAKVHSAGSPARNGVPCSSGVASDDQKERSPLLMGVTSDHPTG